MCICRYGHLDEIWGLLKNIVPQFQLPELPVEKPAELELKPESAVPESGLGDDAVSEQPLKDGKVCIYEYLFIALLENCFLHLGVGGGVVPYHPTMTVYSSCHEMEF